MNGLIFTYVLTAGGAVSSLVDPFKGLMAYICLAIIRPEYMWYWCVSQGNYSRIVAIALLFGWLLNGFGDWRLGGATAIVNCLVAYLAFMAVSSAFAVGDPAQSFLILEQTAKIVLPFVIGISLIHSVQQIKAIIYMMAIVMTYVAFEMNLAYYSGFNRIYDFGFGGLDNNGCAVTMVTAVGLTFYLALAQRKWWLTLAWFGAIGLMVNCVMMSFSRGGLVALLITASLGFLLVPKRARHYLMFFLAIGMGYRLAGPSVVERFMTSFVSEDGTREESAQSRIDLWYNCLTLAGENPFFGIGPQQFPLISDRFGWSKGKQAHTTWLQIAAEQGLPGILSIAGFYWLTIMRLWGARRQLAMIDPWLADLVRMCIASVVGFAVAAQFVSLQAVEMPFYIVLAGAGALKLLYLAQAEPGRLYNSACWIGGTWACN